MERERGVIERGKVIEVAESGYRIACLSRASGGDPKANEAVEIASQSFPRERG